MTAVCIMPNNAFVVRSGSARGFMAPSTWEPQRCAPPAVTDYVFSEIQNGILSGDILPGARLNQLALARQFSVDQRTVREALSRLVARGLAVHTHNRGTRVIALDLAGVEEVYKVRSLLEPWAMTEAAQRIPKSDLDAMRKILPLTAGSDSPEGVDRAREANREFHWIAIRACGRQQLIRLLDQVWDLSLTYALRGVITSTEKARADSADTEHHLDLVDALAVGDGEAAAAVARSHILTSLQHLIERWKMLHGTQIEVGDAEGSSAMRRVRRKTKPPVPTALGVDQHKR